MNSAMTTKAKRRWNGSKSGKIKKVYGTKKISMLGQCTICSVLVLVFASLASWGPVVQSSPVQSKSRAWSADPCDMADQSCPVLDSRPAQPSPRQSCPVLDSRPAQPSPVQSSSLEPRYKFPTATYQEINQIMFVDFIRVNEKELARIERARETKRKTDALKAAGYLSKGQRKRLNKKYWKQEEEAAADEQRSQASTAAPTTITAVTATTTTTSNRSPPSPPLPPPPPHQLTLPSTEAVATTTTASGSTSQ